MFEHKKEIFVTLIYIIYTKTETGKGRNYQIKITSLQDGNNFSSNQTEIKHTVTRSSGILNVKNKL